VLFATLAVAFVGTIDSDLQIAANLRDSQVAFSAAESGLNYARWLISTVGDLGRSYDPNVSENEAAAAWNALTSHVIDELDYTANIGGAAMPGVELIYENELPIGERLRVPAIALQSGGATFELTFSRYNDDPYTIHVSSTGNYRNAQRAVSLDFSITKDTSILTYSVAAKSGIIVWSGSQIQGDIYSTWDIYDVGSGRFYPPYVVSDDSVIQGRIKTRESQQGWEENNLGDYIDGEYDEITFNEPVFDEQFDRDDFDTSAYKQGLTSLDDLPAPDYIEYDEPFPPDHSSPREWFDRPVYVNRHFTNILIPKGTNPKFINCTFEQITYIDVDENVTDLPKKSYWERHNSDWWPDSYSNNCEFIGCTFLGPLISAVPQDYFWTKNSISFSGGCEFYNDFMEESTILAPNFNVNIGSFTKNDGTSVLDGIIIGGIVDVRGDAIIEGTILSMFKPSEDLGSGRIYYRTNIGFYGDAESGSPDDTGTTIIRPHPERSLPMGIVTSIVSRPVESSYQEQ